MSANQSASARPKRVVRGTQRAQEILAAGEGLPGIAAPLTPSTSGSDDPGFTQSITHAMARNSSRGRGRGGRPAVVRNQHGADFPTFSPDTFPLYSWPQSRPLDFTRLSDAQRAWKREVDERDRVRDIDDGADDWHEFGGNRAAYPVKDREGFALEYAVASAFVNRAKRAFWAGKSWDEFEREERRADSEASAKAEVDAERRRLLFKEVLNNDLRLRVFDALKRRLCEEIWLQVYTDPPALVKLPTPNRDSKSPAPARPNRVADPTIERGRRPATEEDARNGIAYWSLDGYGVRQPVYADERAIPSGVSTFIQDMREQRWFEGTSAARHSHPHRTQNLQGQSVPRSGQMRRTAAEEIARRDPDFSDSDNEDA